MNTLEAVPTIKLWKEGQHGALRIGETRVSLDSIIFHFKLGASAEQIFHKFPDLTLADIYGAISYYLTHRDEVEIYLTKQQAKAEDLSSRTDSTFGKQNAELRLRILARNDERLNGSGDDA